MAVDLRQVFNPAINVYGEPFVVEGESPRWALYLDTDRGAYTGHAIASGDIPKDHPLRGVEDDWLYGDEAWDFLALVDADEVPQPGAEGA